MAIYKPPKARWPLAVAAFVGGLVLGVIVALLLQSDPAPADVAADVQAELAAAAGSLEVVAIEYDESVEAGDIVSEAEFRGAKSALESSRHRYSTVAAAVEALAPERAAAIENAYADAETQMDEQVEPSELQTILDELDALLRGEES